MKVEINAVHGIITATTDNMQLGLLLEALKEKIESIGPAETLKLLS